MGQRHNNTQKATKEQFKQRITELTNAGFIPMPMPKTETFAKSQPDVLNSLAAGGDGAAYGSNFASRGHGLFCGKDSPVPVPGDIGTPGKGFIEWGSGNRLPNIIPLLVGLLPYTAAAVKFNVDTMVNTGPKPMYRWFRYTNGTVKTERVDFDSAGVLIKCRIMDLMATLARLESETGNASSQQDSADGNITDTLAGAGVNVPKNSTANMLRKAINEAIDALNQEYDVWKLTNEKVKTFQQNNNLLLTYLKLCVDYAHMDICFPQFELGQGGNERPWNAEINGLKHRSCLCCRMEEKDSEGKVNYVYVSNRWLTDSVSSLLDNEIIAIPALNPESPIGDLRRVTLRNRESVRTRRPTRFILPVFYPSMDHPYYPHPAFWSVFSSKVYSYADTLIKDKAIARENSNSWGKIVYVHVNYINSLYASAEATTQKEKDIVIQQMWDQINGFLKDKTNNGKTMIGYSMMDNQGKPYKSYEIVDVPDTTNGANTKDELEEIASILFFALEIQPSMIGAVPGKSGSTGGTFQRELFLLKQARMGPSKKCFTHIMEVISKFNKWDEHLEWVLPDVVLTTLDAQKTGLTENINN
jgi:hypothetical protein